MYVLDKIYLYATQTNTELVSVKMRKGQKKLEDFRPK